MTSDHDDPDLPPADDEDGEDAPDSLSPSVRRLVKQYGLDVTAIRGSGPAGRIRVGDVVAALGGRANVQDEREPDDDEPPAGTEDARAAPGSAIRADLAVPFALPSTTVFECDLGAVAAHRRASRERGVEISVLSYLLFACTRALDATPEANGPTAAVHLGVVTSIEGETRTVLIRNAREIALEGFQGELRAAQNAPRGGVPPEGGRGAATLRVQDYGAAGSVLALPLPLGENGTASLGLGRPRRQLVVRRVEGEEVPRAATLCYLTLTFDPDSLSLERANRYLARLVHILELWPPSA